MPSQGTRQKRPFIARNASSSLRAAGDRAVDPTSGNGDGSGEGLWHQARNELADNEIGRRLISAGADDEGSANLRYYGRFVVFGGVIVGFAVPAVSEMLKPFLSALLIATLVFGLLQVDFERLAGFRKQAWPITGLLFAVLLLLPVFVALEAKVVLVPYGLPQGIADGLILAALSPPLLAAPAIAFLLGLDSLLAFVVAMIAHLLAPLTVTFLAQWLVGPHLQIDSVELMSRLTLIIGAGFAIGLALRRIPLTARVSKQHRGVVDILSIVTLTLLAAALMDGVAEIAINDPQYVLIAVACGFLLNPLLQLLGAFLFVKSGFEMSLTVGLLAGYRNVGLLIAALAGGADQEIIAFLAIVQIPAFVIPMLSGPVLKKVKSIGFDTP